MTTFKDRYNENRVAALLSAQQENERRQLLSKSKKTIPVQPNPSVDTMEEQQLGQKKSQEKAKKRLQASPAISKLKQAVNAAYNKVTKPDVLSAAIIDLSNSTLGRIDDNHPGTSILANEFVEDVPNNIRLARDFINTTDTLIGDRQIPLSRFSQFYGIENGKLKIGPLTNFNSNTTVVPVRNKNIGKIKQIIYPEVKDVEQIQAQIDSIKEAHEPERIKFYESRGKNPGFIDYAKSLFSKYSPQYIKGFNSYPRPYSNYPSKLYKLYDALDNQVRLVNENNDTIGALPIIDVRGKTIFADGQGNTVFVNALLELDKTGQDYLNNKLKDTPMYPILVDNGRYSDFYPQTGPNQNYQTYIQQDLYRDPSSLFVIGEVN